MGFSRGGFVREIYVQALFHGEGGGWLFFFLRLFLVRCSPPRSMGLGINVLSILLDSDVSCMLGGDRSVVFD